MSMWKAYSVIILLMLMSTANAAVVVTISDLKPIVEAVAGDKIEVVSILPPGTDPHHFSLSIENVRTLHSAELIVLANSELFGFEKKIKEEFTNVLDFTDYNAELEDFPNYPQNPHGYWLKPKNAIGIAKAVCEKLSEMYPEKREYFEKNLRDFSKKIEESVREAKKIASEFRGKKFVAAVPGVCYIATSLDIDIAAVLLSEGS